MRKSNLFPITFCLTLLLMIVESCSPTVLFNSPQPDGKKNLVQFLPVPGEYESLDDTSISWLKNI